MRVLAALALVLCAHLVAAGDIWKVSNCPGFKEQSTSLLEASSSSSIAKVLARKASVQQKLNPIQEFICNSKFSYKDKYGDYQCRPQYRPATTQPAKGVIVCLHGYSACPQQCNSLGDQLSNMGYDVFAPTHPGHGRPFGCKAGPTCVEPGYDVTGVPTDYKGYKEYVDALNQAVSAHASGKDNAVFGLSVGGALASVATSLNPTLYKSLGMYSPFFGVTQPKMDLDMIACQKKNAADKKAVAKCLQEVVKKANPSSFVDKFINTLVGMSGSDEGWTPYNNYARSLRLAMREANSMKDKLGSVLNNNFGWGAGCEKARDASQNSGQHRAGFCGFKVANLIGVHDLGSNAIDIAGKGAGRVHIRMVERDMIQRNGLIYQVAKKLKKAGAKVSAEMYRMVCTDKLFDDNSCGVPHASLSFEDNVSLPGGFYWQKNIESEIIDFLTGKKDSFGSATWDPKMGGDARVVPQQLSLDQDPPEDLVAKISDGNFLTNAGEKVKLITALTKALLS